MDRCRIGPIRITVRRRILIKSSQYPPRRVHGIDFSGAKDAGRRIWMASGIIEGDILLIEECRRAGTLPGSGKSRDACFSALRDFIEKDRTGVFGFDFPFGLPQKLIKENSWRDFFLDFQEN